MTKVERFRKDAKGNNIYEPPELRDPAGYTDEDRRYMEQRAQGLAAKIVRDAVKKGGTNAAEFQRQLVEQLIKATPQAPMTSGSDLFTYQDAQDEDEFRKLYNQAKENERNNTPPRQF